LSIVRAQNLFRRFFGRNPDDCEIVEVATKEPEVTLVIGELDGVIYRTEGSKEPFIHRFKKSDRPLLLVSCDGRQIYVLKGAYRFTERGFVG
jgi:hypothetical protein